MNAEDRERLFDSLVSASTRDGTLDPHPETEKHNLAMAREVIAEIRRRKRLSEVNVRETMRPRVGSADLRNSRLNADKDMRDLMRPPVGPADLRNSRLNNNRDLRESMRPQPGPAHLRNSHFHAEKELREVMKPKARSSDSLESGEATTDKLVNEMEAAVDKLADELDSNLKKRDYVIRRLKDSLDEKETSRNDDDSNVTSDTCDYNTNKEGEVEPSEDEMSNVVQYSDSDLETYDYAERTKQMEEILNFQKPSEGLELVILLHTQY